MSDLDYLYLNRIFTHNANYGIEEGREFLARLHANGQYWLPILDPNVCLKRPQPLIILTEYRYTFPTQLTPVMRTPRMIAARLSISISRMATKLTTGLNGQGSLYGPTSPRTAVLNSTGPMSLSATSNNSSTMVGGWTFQTLLLGAPEAVALISSP